MRRIIIEQHPDMECGRLLYYEDGKVVRSYYTPLRVALSQQDRDFLHMPDEEPHG